jgi:hypothetical protein
MLMKKKHLRRRMVVNMAGWSAGMDFTASLKTDLPGYVFYCFSLKTKKY